jgi:hypothetical protein
MPKKKPQQDNGWREILQVSSKSERAMMSFNKGRPLNLWETFVADMKVELGVLWRQWLYRVTIVVIYIIYFAVLIWLLPHLFDWFFSFP